MIWGPWRQGGGVQIKNDFTCKILRIFLGKDFFFRDLLFIFVGLYLKRQCGIEQRSAQLAHNQQVVGSNPTPATDLLINTIKFYRKWKTMFFITTKQPKVQLFTHVIVNWRLLGRNIMEHMMYGNHVLKVYRLIDIKNLR